MRILAANIALPLLAFSAANQSLAQTVTDAAAQVRQLLNEVGPVPVEHVWYTHSTVLNQVSGKSTRHATVTNQLLTATNIAVVSSTTPAFGKPTIVSFPTVPANGAWIWANCSQVVTPTYTEQVSYSETNTATIQVSHGVSNTVGGKVDFGYSAYGFKFDGEISGSRQWTTTSTNINADSKQYTYAGSVSVTSFPKNTAVIAKTVINQETITTPFTATIVVDADLSGNQNGWTKLSQAVPDAAKRTFTISGEVTETNWGNGQSTTVDTKFDPSFCSPTDKGMVKIPLR
jgi:hypothetical protein